MPITKPTKVTQPLWKEWEKRAQRQGQLNTVYSVNGDHYTGEWNDNKKNGKMIGECFKNSLNSFKIYIFYLLVKYKLKRFGML